MRRKQEVHYQLLFDKFDRILVSPCQQDKINCTRRMGRQIRANIIFGVKLLINLLIIRVEYKLEELLHTETGGEVTVV